MVMFSRVFLLAFYGIFRQVHSENNITSPDYEIFRDDFSLSHLNSNKWNAANEASELNDELEYYRPENVFIENDQLHLQAQHQEYGDYNYTSGRVDTKDKFDFLYGEVEWRARVAKGKGLWSALWLLPVQCQAAVACEQSPPAVSMIDVRGDRLRESVLTVFWRRHRTEDVRSADRTITHPVDMSLDFHLYKLVWLPTSLTWFIDGKEVFNVTGRRRVPSVRMQVSRSKLTSFFVSAYQSYQKRSLMSISNGPSNQQKSSQDEVSDHMSILAVGSACFFVMSDLVER
jgi:beta-glucanase (GH16 family)